MKSAVVGCSHGALDTIYSTIRRRDSDARKTSDPAPIDLLLCCGDFQAMRNGADLKTMDAPAKYCRLEDL